MIKFFKRKHSLESFSFTYKSKENSLNKLYSAATDPKISTLHQKARGKHPDYPEKSDFIACTRFLITLELCILPSFL